MTRFLRGLDRFLSRISQPFSKADSLEVYSKNGYWCFGAMLIVLLILLLLLLGYLDQLVGAAPPSIQPPIAKLLEKVGLGFLPPSTPIVVLLVAVFVVVGFIKRIRTPVGEFLSNAAFRLMEFAVFVGEWCIEHRAISSVLILALMAALAGAFTYQIEKTKREQLLRQNFNNWLEVAERFIERNTVTKLEINEYKLVDQYWRQDFTRIFDLPVGQKHPALYLHQMMELLYSEPKEVPFQQFLRTQLPDLQKIVKNCESTLRPPEKRSLDENRSWDLLNIQMGRIYNRLSEKSLSQGNPTERCEQCEADQRTALNYFKAVDLEKYGTSDYRKTYGSAIRNGQGTVYTNVFTSSLIWRQSVRTDDVCGGDAIQCAVMALEQYDKAGEGFEQCSFQGVRRLNNVTDMISRIAIVYPQVVDKNPVLQKHTWMENKTALAARLEALIKDIMSCNAKGVFISSVFLTSAQGYAAAAALEPTNESSSQLRLKSAASYMRMAYSYEPHNVQDWELFYFCPAVEGEDLVAVFRDEVSRSDGLQMDNPKFLTHVIKTQCQKVLSPPR
jgi:hypothetical protein